MARSFEITYLIASRSSAAVRVNSGMYLRLRLVKRLPLRFRVLNDGNWDPCNKRASVPFTTSLYDNFYLRLHLPDILSAVKFAKTSTRKLLATPFPPEARICKICFSIALFSRRSRIISFSSLGHIR